MMKEKIINALRYILFLPLAFIGAGITRVILYASTKLVCTISFVKTDVCHEVDSSFFLGDLMFFGVFVMVSQYVVPSFKKQVAIVELFFILLLLVAIIVFNILNGVFNGLLNNVILVVIAIISLASLLKRQEAVKTEENP